MFNATINFNTSKVYQLAFKQAVNISFITFYTGTYREISREMLIKVVYMHIIDISRRVSWVRMKQKFETKTISY